MMKILLLAANLSSVRIKSAAFWSVFVERQTSTKTIHPDAVLCIKYCSRCRCIGHQWRNSLSYYSDTATAIRWQSPGVNWTVTAIRSYYRPHRRAQGNPADHLLRQYTRPPAGRHPRNLTLTPVTTNDESRPETAKRLTGRARRLRPR